MNLRLSVVKLRIKKVEAQVVEHAEYTPMCHLM